MDGSKQKASGLDIAAFVFLAIMAAVTLLAALGPLITFLLIWYGLMGNPVF